MFAEYTYVMMDPLGNIVFAGKLGGRSDFIPMAASKASTVVRDSSAKALVDPSVEDPKGFFRYYFRTLPAFLCCRVELGTIGAQAVQMKEKVGAFAVAGGRVGQPEHEICLAALEAAGYVQGRNGVWALYEGVK